MTTVDSHQQFKCQTIVGVSLSNDLHHSHQIHSNVDTNEEQQQQVFHNKPNQLSSSSVPLAAQLEKPQLQIVGSELTSKTSKHQLSSKHVYSSAIPLLKLSRSNQTMLQTPKRTTFTTHRKTQQNLYSKTWTSHVARESNPVTSDKLAIVSSHRPVNTSTQDSIDRSIIPQRTQVNPSLHSSITILKRTPTANNQTSPRSFTKIQQSTGSLERDISPLKLPSLLKKPPPAITKSIPSAYIQQLTRFQASSSTSINRRVLQPTPVLPIYTSRRSITLFTEQQHLSLIKDRMSRANLAQKATFKCKSPLPHRSESSLSRSTTVAVNTSEIQTKSTNPLKHMMVGSLLSETDCNKLKRLFHQLDTDRDGHLTYPQVQKCLPPNLPRAQQTFFRVLYDITSDTTYFGLSEFLSMIVLIKMIDEQDSHIWNTLLDDVDFNYYHDHILEFLDEFDSCYSPLTFTITFDHLLALMINQTTNDQYDRIRTELENIIPMIQTMTFTRLQFIALVPVLIYIESCLDHGKSLFRFRDNSILNLHIQKASLT